MIAQTWTSSPWFWVIAFFAAIAGIHFRDAIERFLFRKNNASPGTNPTGAGAGDETITDTAHGESSD